MKSQQSRVFQYFFLIRRLSNYISKKRLRRVADSLSTSKIRYGFQLLGKVRIDHQDSTSNLLNKIQVTQNKFMRFMGNKSLLDKIPTKTLFEDTNLISVNQLNAQCKLLEVWKSLNNPRYPITWEKNERLLDSRTRSIQNELLTEPGSSMKTKATFISDAAWVWNRALDSIKNCKSFYKVKVEIKKFIGTLPI